MEEKLSLSVSVASPKVFRNLGCTRIQVKWQKYKIVSMILLQVLKYADGLDFHGGFTFLLAPREPNCTMSLANVPTADSQ